MGCYGRKVSIILVLLAVAFFVASLLIILVLVPIVLDNEIEKSTRLENGTKQWDRFVKIPFPLNFKVYMFDVKNSEEILNNGKPQVEEKGPFAYGQYRRKYDVKFEDENNAVSFYQQQQYLFSKWDSQMDEQEETVILNLPLLVLIQTGEYFPTLPIELDIDKIIESVFEEPKLFVKAPVKNSLFNGLKFCTPSRLNAGGRLFCLIAMLMKLKNVEYLADGSMLFSFFKYKKDTHDGHYKLNSGMSDISSLGRIIEWNGSNYTKFWKGGESECNKVIGYDATLYPPHVGKDQVFDIFATDICRTVGVHYDSESVYQDIDGYRFTVKNTTLYADNPKDSCYCLEKTTGPNNEKTCYLDGVIDLYTCFGVEVLLSFPHFLWADEKYTNGVTGVSPNETKHLTYVELEPNTGTPLQGVKRAQINAVLRPITFQSKVIKMTENLRGTVLPLLWLEEGVSLPPNYVRELEEEYFDKVSLLNGLLWALVAVAVFCVIISGVCSYRLFKRKSRNQILTN